MGRRAAGALLLALLLHGRLLAVSVRAAGRGRPGPARRARQLGGGADAALLELRFRTRIPSGTPGSAQAGRQRPAPPPAWGCPEGRPGNPVGPGAGPPAWEPVGRPATLSSLRVALGSARPSIPGDQAEKL